MFLTYPAHFYKLKNKDMYFISFPDLGATQGNSIEDSIEMAQDYLGTYLQEYYEKGIEMPVSSGIDGLEINENIEFAEEYDFEKSFTSLVGLDIAEYTKLAKKQTVRRNVSIPMYLNEYAKREKINVSRLITSLLEEKFEEI
ncbi:type II toxin-antitoxin system HicB family antitoxin [Helcococcus ovis]|uniref:Type II toxin-antitoxin system HicB family antitoxin n=1 Tax=Helcococcus ovis TaxID=72026 RepID=A0A4V3IY56_9FIRM|nr:type II toxin-antitoxin system HicB family antitoxin [Helcococcus ovis]TFF64090.1 type II toxin-antitoxin system HicB family antitoxin [Helcococcus ovis]TFF64977.1 type II toxin-antitoxin system HicB family antitoxin [Helcococcus ovis]TFF67896.1 type II toxin-antitoxin system HicB family antitoxin [Helcococcus ovis]WNZ01584.1 type II toxin-antitoxin system HicB family antitoxin [Helcococcus ovis]